jgi:hypothetical protein
MRLQPLTLSLALILAAAVPGFTQTGGQTDISTEIAATGLGPTEARLAALPSPTEAERFALGGVRFLLALEDTLQLRWSAGIPPSMTGLPALSLPLAENPNAPPFDPASIAALFRDVAARMPGVVEPLATLPEGSDFTLTIDLGDLWFDIDGDGQRSPGEGLVEVAGPMLFGWQWQERDPSTPTPVIAFDLADAAWLSAYAHLLSGVSNAVLAYDPTQAITTVLGARAALAELAGPNPAPGSLEGMSDWIDTASIVIRALDQVPDAARAAAARTSLLAMVADNRLFWQRLALETDNDREWIPNDTQTSALGLTLPPGTGAVWLSVLSDAEALLKGERLVPYVWLGEGAGIDLGLMFTDPRPIDIAGWIQGADALPYARRGPLVSGESWFRFSELVQGDTLLFALLLN